MHRFGKKISALRKLRKMTQKEFASLAEINYRHFQDIEGDKSNIRVSTAVDIASVLKVPVETLFDEQVDLNLLNSGIHTSWRALEELPAGVLIINLEGKILFWNRFFKSYLTQLSEKNASCDFHVWELLPPQDRAEGKNYFLRIMKEMPSPTISRRSYIGPGNKTIDVIIFWDYLKDENGKVTGFISNVVPAAPLKPITGPLVCAQ